MPIRRCDGNNHRGCCRDHVCTHDNCCAGGGEHDVHANDNRDTANHHRPGRIGALQRRDRLWHRHLPDRQQRVPGRCQVAVPHRFTGCRMR